MTRYVIRRILLIIPIVIGVVVVVFTINFFGEGSPAVTILGTSGNAEKIAELEHEMGFDRPYIVQLADYFWQIISKGSLGNSYIYKIPVWTLMKPRILPTSVVSFAGIILAVIIGIPMGILAATRQYSVFDYGGTLLAILLNAIPNYWLALMLMLFFGVQLRWLPISGYSTWMHYVLPVLSCGLGPITSTMRMTRSSMLEVIRQDYIRTAKSKGIANRAVIYRHALKNALIPVVTQLGMQLGVAMTGAIIVETIFQIPGLGTLMNTSIAQKDYIVVQGCVIICAVLITIANLLTDIAYAFIDPRIKAQYEGMSRDAKDKRAAKKTAGKGVA